MSSHEHWGHYIDKPDTPEALNVWLKFHGRVGFPSGAEPECYATLNTTHVEHCREYGVENGNRVKLLMASRFGDVGITKDLRLWRGYDVRVYIEDLKDFSNTP